MKKYFFILFLALISSRMNAQKTSAIDSLEKLVVSVSDTAKARIYNDLSWLYRNKEPDRALQYASQALEKAQKHENYHEIARAYGFKGIAYRNKRNYEQALDHFNMGLDVCETHNLTGQKGYAYTNIANIYLYKEDADKTQEYQTKARDLARIIHDTAMIAYSYLNLGRAELLRKESDVALVNLFVALQIRQAKRLSGQSVCLKYIGDAYIQKNETDSAFFYFQKAYKSAQSEYDTELSATLLTSLASIYISKKDFTNAEQYAFKAYETALKTKNPARIQSAYETLAQLFKHKGDFANAVKYFELAKLYSDSVYQIELDEKISNVKYTGLKEKSEKEITELRKIEEANERDLQQQRIFIILLVIVVVLIGLTAFFMIQQIRVRKRANILLARQHQEILEKNSELHAQNEEISSQRDEITRQKETLEKQHSELENQKVQLEIKTEEIIRQAQKITDSIIYAQRIQNALLPPEQLLQSVFSDYFILYKPRDIVSGDFYWVKQSDDKIIAVLADCTGHGVPGAFLSMLGMSVLNKVFEEEEVNTAAEILEKMRRHIKLSLRQSSDLESQDDGLDMALCIIEKNTGTMQFAGANNALYVVRNKAIEIVPATLNPVGIYFREIPFKNNIVQLQPGDCIYMFSDGFQDQFGGEDGRRFMSANFKDMILRHYELPMSVQKTVYEKRLSDWMGKNRQIDDVSLMGIRIDSIKNE